MSNRPGSPRRLAALFLALVLVPSLLLAGLGWQLFKQDRLDAVRQVDDRRGETANLAVAAIEQAIAASEQSLRGLAASGRARFDDAAVVMVARDQPTVVVGGPALPFIPMPSPGVDVPSAPFLEA